MSYEIYDSKGPVHSGPSIGGLADLKQELMTKKISSAGYPQLASFLYHGFANSPLRFKLECVALSRAVNDPTVKSTLIELGKGAAKAKGIIILHDGVS